MRKSVLKLNPDQVLYRLPKCTAKPVPLAEAAEGRKEVGVRVQCVEHILLKQIVGHVEKRAERIAGAEELRERGSRIAVELVCKVV